MLPFFLAAGAAVGVTAGDVEVEEVLLSEEAVDVLSDGDSDVETGVVDGANGERYAGGATEKEMYQVNLMLRE